MPSKTMSPLVGLSKVDSKFKSVVLPAPDGPIIDKNSPSSTDKDILFKTLVLKPLIP